MTPRVSLLYFEFTHQLYRFSDKSRDSTTYCQHRDRTHYALLKVFHSSVISNWTVHILILGYEVDCVSYNGNGIWHTLDIWTPLPRDDIGMSYLIRYVNYRINNTRDVLWIRYGIRTPWALHSWPDVLVSTKEQHREWEDPLVSFLPQAILFTSAVHVPFKL